MMCYINLFLLTYLAPSRQSCVTTLGKLFTLMCLSLSSITWYWLRNGGVLQLLRWPQAWRKVMAAYCRGWFKKSPLGCSPGSAPAQLSLSNEYLRTLHLLFYIHTYLLTYMLSILVCPSFCYNCCSVAAAATDVIVAWQTWKVLRSETTCYDHYHLHHLLWSTWEFLTLAETYLTKL